MVDEVGELSLYRERAETDVVEFVGWACSLDMATEKPDELIGSEGGSVGDALVVIFGLTCLSVLEVRPKFVVDV